MIMPVKIYDKRTSTWIETRVNGETWEDKSRDLMFVRFFETTIIYSKEQLIIEGSKE